MALHVLAGLAARGSGEVFIDNALTTADAYHHDVNSPRYPTNESTQNAYRKFLTKIGKGLIRSTITNATDSRSFRSLWKNYIAPLIGGFDEFFIDWSSTSKGSSLCDCGADGWAAQVKEITDAGVMSKVAVVRTGTIDPTADAEGLKYSLGSYLLGGHSMFVFSADYNWHSAFDWNLGSAIGAFYSVGNHIYGRDFSNGAVTVQRFRGLDRHDPAQRAVTRPGHPCRQVGHPRPPVRGDPAGAERRVQAPGALGRRGPI